MPNNVDKKGSRLPYSLPTLEPETGAKAKAAEADLERMADLLRPLASPVRLRLLRFLTQPHYLEEVASHLKLSRQAARKHLDQLVAIGVLEKRASSRSSGPVTDYVINEQALFLIYDEFEKLGSLRTQQQSDLMVRTMAEPGKRAAAEASQGPCLFVVRGLNLGRRVPLTSGRPVLIGRDTRSDLVLSHDPYASNRHVEVRAEKDKFVLVDLRSTNGTTYNWAPMPGGSERVLRHGDLVGIGKTLLLFWEGP